MKIVCNVNKFNTIIGRINANIKLIKYFETFS